MPRFISNFINITKIVNFNFRQDRSTNLNEHES